MNLKKAQGWLSEAELKATVASSPRSNSGRGRFSAIKVELFDCFCSTYVEVIMNYVNIFLYFRSFVTILFGRL